MMTHFMDICSYCEAATDSIQKSIENGNYDGAHIQLSAYLLEVYSRYQNNEIDEETYKESLRFYRRMTVTLIDECSINQQLNNYERED